MDLNLKGKKAVVTGATAGIGFACAKQFLLEGAEVVISGRNQERLDEALKELSAIAGPEKVKGYILDCSKEEDVMELGRLAAGEEGRIDAWVNNVGTNKQRAGELYTDAELNYLIDANFKSAVFGAQAAYTYMKKHGGAIVNIASMAARTATCGRSTIYGGLKAGVLGLTKCQAGEFAAYGIRVNAVMPGYTLTPLVKSTFTKEALDHIVKDNLQRRMADPDEIARPVVFLASDGASYINGTFLEITGGHQTVINPEWSYEKREADERKVELASVPYNGGLQKL